MQRFIASKMRNQIKCKEKVGKRCTIYEIK
jgi:hypothetical protein